MGTKKEIDSVWRGHRFGVGKNVGHSLLICANLITIATILYSLHVPIVCHHINPGLTKASRSCKMLFVNRARTKFTH